MSMRITATSFCEVYASLSAKLTSPGPTKRLPELQKQHVAPYDSYSKHKGATHHITNETEKQSGRGQARRRAYGNRGWRRVHRLKPQSQAGPGGPWHAWRGGLSRRISWYFPHSIALRGRTLCFR